ncbi:hypothetical protein ABEB36_009712 [Hypothenemus hampei]|uniref:Uncharacterized protein n=1 Tax=Hypothenemus hampei TaxID=57062 RepID=A0ABD1EH85_HYPHA
MVVAGLSTTYTANLIEFHSTSEANFVYAFNNAMARKHRRKNFIKTIHDLHPVLLAIANTNIQLTNLQSSWLPDYKIQTFSINLPKLCLDIEFKIGDLTVTGNYETNNLKLRNVLPVTNTGTVTVNYLNAELKGRVGLLIEGDSFMPENFDVEYSKEKSEVIVSYYVDKDTKVENQVTAEQEEQIIADKIWIQLTEEITNILRETLREVIVEFSVEESLGNEDELLREYVVSQTRKANALFDVLLCSAKDHLVESKLQILETPGFEVLYKGKPSSTITGIFDSGRGLIKDLSSLSRLSDLSLFEDEHQLLVYGTLTIRDFRHDYENFSTTFDGNHLTGSLKAQIYELKIFVKLSFDRNEEKNGKAKVEKLEVRSLRGIHVDTSGLGSLSWLIPNTQSWLIGHLRATTLDILLKRIESVFSYATNNELKKSQAQYPEGENSRQFWRNIFSKN